MPDKGNIELLLEKKLIDNKQLGEAKNEARKTGMSIERALEKLGFITKESIAQTIAEAIGVPFMDLTEYLIDQEVISLVPENVACKFKLVPLFKIGQTLTLAMTNPKDIVALDEVRKVSGFDTVEAVLSTEEGIQGTIEAYYATANSVNEIVDSIGKEELIKDEELDLNEVAVEAPIIKLVNVIIVKAVKGRASDIHIEPEESSLRVRNRIDGVLHEVYKLPRRLHRGITSRIKILADMDIAESRRPQDGKMRLKLEGKNLDMRVSTFPTVHGENIVIRILDKSSVILGLKELGFSEDNLGSFDKLIHNPNGILLVTGPTGSGKTSTLYAALTTINSLEKNIITIEDPVEYELPLIRQTQVNPKAGITFANGLRAILRQDPDMIMVGEIRDKETAEIAVRAALTGHLVFSTLHTNDSTSALTRLIDMGVEPFLISSSVIGILAQRLVRCICEKCKEVYTPDQTILADLNIKKGQKFYKGKGCKKCGNNGFLGRTGIFELLMVDDQIRDLANEKASASQIKEACLKKGMKFLLDDGMEKVASGITTIEEVLRVSK